MSDCVFSRADIRPLRSNSFERPIRWIRLMNPFFLRVVKIFDTGSFEIIDGICSVVAQGKYRWPLLCHCLLGKSVLRSGANLSWTVPFPLYLYIGNGNGAARTIQRPSVFVNDRIRYRAHSQSLDIIRKACFPDPPKSQ